jgi:hypothetical protein
VPQAVAEELNGLGNIGIAPLFGCPGTDIEWLELSQHGLVVLKGRLSIVCNLPLGGGAVLGSATVVAGAATFGLVAGAVTLVAVSSLKATTFCFGLPLGAAVFFGWRRLNAAVFVLVPIGAPTFLAPMAVPVDVVFKQRQGVPGTAAADAATSRRSLWKEVLPGDEGTLRFPQEEEPPSPLPSPARIGVV